MTATRIGELFATRIEEKIEPVIKVGETSDEKKLAAEIGDVDSLIYAAGLNADGALG